MRGRRTASESGATVTYVLSFPTRRTAKIDQGTAPGVTITAGALSSVAVTPASLTAGATGNVTISFTNSNAWPANGKLVVTFPAGFDVSAVTAGAITGADGTATAAVAGQTVTVTRAGGATTTGGGTAVSITLGGTRNPQVSGTTGTFSLSTATWRE